MVSPLRQDIVIDQELLKQSQLGKQNKKGRTMKNKKTKINFPPYIVSISGEIALLLT